MIFSTKKIIKADLKDVYNFFSEAENWENNVPHCKKIEYLEKSEQNNITEEKIKMTVISNGSNEEFITKRWKVKNKKITYNQLTPPGAILMHTGEWKFDAEDDHTIVQITHLISVCHDVDNFPELKQFTYKQLEKKVEELITFNSHQIIDSCESFILRESKEVING